MKPIDPEFNILTEIYRVTHKKPTPAQYRKKIIGTDLPSVEELSRKYGSAQAMVNDFVVSYQEEYGLISGVPDYLLGSLAGRCKLVRRSNGWTYLRYIISDEDQIEAVATYLHHFSIVPTKKGTNNYEMRILDHDLMTSLIALNFFENTPFRPSVDFVRGYCDGHSAIRSYTGTGDKRLVRMTLSGKLVPQVHDYLVQIGASNTSIIREGSSLRMHINGTSLRRIRDVLYPSDCVCNARKRATIFQDLTS